MRPEIVQKKIGKGMIIFAWLILLGLMTLYFDRYLSHQENPNQDLTNSKSDEENAVLLKRNRAGHYVATALINHIAVEVLLDTGATYVSVPGHLARKLNLQKGMRYTVSTANGNIDVFDTVLESVQIGNILQTDVRANINPSMNENTILIGMNFLKRLELIQRGDELILRQY